MVKTTRFAFAFLFAFIFVIGMGSADLIVTPSAINVNSSSTSFSMIFNNIGTSAIENVSVSFALTGGAIPTISLFNVANGSIETKTSTVTITPNQLAGSYSGTANVIVNGIQNVTVPITLIVLPVPLLSVQSKEVLENQNQTTINVTNNGNVDLTGVSLSITNSSFIKFNVLNGSQSIAKGNSVQFTVNVDSSSIGSSRVGVFENTITATNGTVSATGTLSVKKGYCKSGDIGTFVRITDIEDRSPGDDWEWEPLKVVKVRVDVDNNQDSRKTITVKLGLFDEGGKSVWLSSEDKELEQSTRIAANDDAIYDFEFTLPADLKRDVKYRLFVKAYDKESEQCNSFSKAIDIDTDKEVIMDELEMPSILTCGATNTISLRVHNLELGDEEMMRVNIYSQELGLNLFSDRFELDEGDNEYVYFNFVIPENKEAKSYRITFYAEYDYRESSDAFRDSESLGTYTVRVDGDKCKATIVPTISASLDSETETMVGKDLVVRMTISNPGNTSSFIVALEGYDSWAKSATLNQSTFNLGVGESRTITATFNPTKSGNQEFVVKAIYGGRVVEQRVSVSIEDNESWFSRVWDSTKGDATFLLSIGVFVVLILIVIVLLVRFVGSSRRE